MYAYRDTIPHADPPDREEHRIKTVRLICHNTNTRALLFYGQLGFVPYRIEATERTGHGRIAKIMLRTETEGWAER